MLAIAWQKKSKLAVAAISLAIAVLALISLWGSLWIWNYEQRRSQFIAQEACVVDSKTRWERYLHPPRTGRWAPVKTHRWVTHVTFKYAPSDLEEQIVATHFEPDPLYPDWGDSAQWDKNIWRTWRVFKVFVNPSNPRDWSLDQGPSRRTYRLLVFDALVILISTSVFVVAIHSPNRNHWPP